MPAEKSLPEAGPPPIDDDAFRDLLARPSVAREMFLPFGRARWEGPRYTLGQGDRRSVAPGISGVRVQEPDPNNVDMHREKGCQRDLVAVVRSIVEMRKTPQLNGVVLGDPKDVLVGPQAGEYHCKRALFGLYCPADGRFRGESDAAAECHRLMIAAGRKAQHRLREEVPPFDPQGGFKGLIDWAERVRWKRQRRSRWWLLALLLPLLFLPCMCSQAPDKIRFFETEIETDSLIILVDKSKSMTPCFPEIRKEAKRFLTEFKKRKREPYANVIFYDDAAKSVLGGIEKLDDKNLDKIVGELDAVTADRGTNLKSGLEMAAKEIGNHGKPTTVLVLTDGEQIRYPLSDLKGEIDTKKSESSVLKPLSGTPAVMKWIPARFMMGQPRRPPDAEEKKWDADMDGVTSAFNANAPKAGSGAGGTGGPGGGRAGGGGAGPGSGGGVGAGGPGGGAAGGGAGASGGGAGGGGAGAGGGANGAGVGAAAGSGSPGSGGSAGGPGNKNAVPDQ